MTLDRCGCCKGVEKLISNRPGLSTLSQRMGTHGSFLQTMKSSLSAGDHPELRGLSTREKDDFSMALMDAWAMVADILTFYQERIATEGYLRTATERWSILELARLVGYRLRPGVASSTYLAFTLEKGYELEIPKGTRAQSLPDPGEQPQSFETMEKVWAREEWGRLLPRTTKPQVITPNPSAETIGHLYVQGLNHELKAGYPIVFDFKSTAVARSIASVELQPEKNRTKVNLIPLETEEVAPRTQNNEAPQTQTLNDLVSKLIPKAKEPTAWQPRIEDAFGIGSDSHLQVFATQCLSGEDQKNLYAALKGDLLSAEPVLKSVRAFGLSAPVFGYNAPKEQIWDEKGLPTGSSREWAIGGTRTIGVNVRSAVNGNLGQIAGISVKSNGKKDYIEVEFGATNESRVEDKVGDQSVCVADKNFSQVRFINAHSEHEKEFCVDGVKETEKSNYLAISEYKDISAGKHLFEVSSCIISKSYDLDPGRRYTIIFSKVEGNGGDPIKFIEHDDHKVADACLRLINAAIGFNKLSVKLIKSDSQDVTEVVVDSWKEEKISLSSGEYEISVNETNLKEKIELKPNEYCDYFVFSHIETLELKSAISKEESDKKWIIRKSTFSFNPSDRKFSLIWNISGLEIDINDEPILKNLTGTRDYQTLLDERTIKITFGEDLDINIVEESALPMPKDNQERRSTVLIDAPGRNIASGTWVVIDRPDETDNTKKKRIFAQVDVSDPVTESNYGIQATVTPLMLRGSCYQQILNTDGTLPDGEGNRSVLETREWLSDKDTSLEVIRKTTVYAENSELTLADEPIDDPIGGKEIELDGLYGSLEPGRLLIVSGERADLPGATDTELAVLSGTFQGKHRDALGKEIESDTLHTFLRLADPLGHEYKRDTVTIFANVARATHGETREEILGSGDGSKNFQEFHLRQSPLTYLAAPTPAGTESTLDLRVNGVLWHEKDSLLQEGPRDRSFITKTDNQDKTEAIFGDGVHGARLPSGVENIKAVYRTGIGKAGNVRANQITILASKPLGLKEVINPLPATGGADRDTIDQARRNIPLTAMSLDHLVSVKDYEDFAKSFAAIEKASATHLSDGRRRLVHVTIAGKGNAPIDKTSDLYLNFVRALFKFGDPNLAIQVDMSEQRLLLMDAEISIGPDYLWSEVEPKIRTKLLERFGFERRELGQDIHLSEIISAMTEIDGVTYVDVNIFHDLPGTILPESLERLVKFILKPPPDGIYRPNQCIYAGQARIEEKYEAEGWEDPQFIANRYGTTLNDLTELNNLADITEKISQHQEIIVPRTIMPAQIAFFTPYVKEMLNLRPRVSRNE